MSASAVTASTTTILFDHDGTLINSEAVHFRLWKDILARYGVNLTEIFYNEVMAGVPVAQNALDVVAHFNLKEDAKVLAQAKHEKVAAFLQQQAFPLMPHAKETIKACFEAGFTLGIVTGGSKLSVEKTLNTYGLSSYISTVVAVEDVQRSKPDPESYLLAMQQLGVTAKACVAVEDTQHGLQSAASAQIKCVVIPGAQSTKHNFSLADVCYGSLQKWLEKEVLTH